LRVEAAPVDRPLQVLGVERKNRKQPADASVKRGSVFHEQFDGDSAIAFVDDGRLLLQVWCKVDAGDEQRCAVRYGIAVTIESETALPIYEEIRQRLVVRAPA
jgi:hypothetical protein